MQEWLDGCAMLGLMIEFLQGNLGLKLNSTREFLQNRRLKWLGYLEKIKENTWLNKYRTLKVSDSFPREPPRKSCNEVTRSDLKEKKFSKDLAVQKCLEVFR